MQTVGQAAIKRDALLLPAPIGSDSIQFSRWPIANCASNGEAPSPNRLALVLGELLVSERQISASSREEGEDESIISKWFPPTTGQLAERDEH